QRAVEQPTQVAPELDVQRRVELEAGLELAEHLRGQRTLRVEGAARREPQQEEGDPDEEDHERYDAEQPAEDEGGHPAKVAPDGRDRPARGVPCPAAPPGQAAPTSGFRSDSREQVTGDAAGGTPPPPTHLPGPG